MGKQWQVGITGGIGAGKSTIAEIFKTLGIPVYHADIEARRLMIEDSSLKDQIADLLGKTAYLPDGQLDRSSIAKKVFESPHLLTRLNGLVHPRVHEDAHRWHHRQRDVPYTLREAALIFESGSYLELDAVIHVAAPVELRIERVVRRDHVGESEVMKRMKHQWPEERRLMLADYVISNDGTSSVIKQALQIHRILADEGEKG